MRNILLFIALIFTVHYAQAAENNTIVQDKLPDGTSLVKIPFNYMDTSHKSMKIRTTEGIYNMHFALPHKWEIIDAKGYVKYSPSILLLKDLSAITLSFNDVIIQQYKLFEHTQNGISFKIDSDLFMRDNNVKMDIIQHYTRECEDGIHSSLWTDIDLDNSYIELHVRPKAIKEELASIEKTLFDSKQYTMTAVNFVIETDNKESLKHFALFTAILSINLNSRQTEIKISDKINPDMHNIIIGTKDQAKKYLSVFNERNDTKLSFETKLSHDINIIQNPIYNNKVIVIIAADSPTKIKESIYALYKSDLSQYKDQGLNINDVQIPAKSEAYSAKNFVPINEKIYFKELGFKTALLKGWYPPKVKVKFKVYPDNHFHSKDIINTYFHYLLPSMVHEDSIVNIYMNNVFTEQVSIAKSAEESNIKIEVQKLFNFDSIKKLPASLIKGSNELKLDFSLVPLKSGVCGVYSTENLVASVLDDSYFILPKSTRWIELPYMQLITEAQYPYSIYPDLQDTVIFLANKDQHTISSAMNFIFYLTQEIGSYPNYIRITTKLTLEDKQKNIVAFGSIDDTELHTLSNNAPIEMNKENMKRIYPTIYNFIEHKNLLSEVRLKKYRLLTSMKETNLPDNSIIVQMFRSTFNSEKSVLFFAANNPLSLEKGVQSILTKKNRNVIQGDLVIYNYNDEEGISFNIKDKYILSQLNWLETLTLMIGYNPLTYMLAFFFLIFMMVAVIKLFLKKFKEEHHPDA